MDKYPPKFQLPALLAFAKACGTRPDALRRDECGEWAILGKRGAVYAVPDGFQIVVLSGSATGWTWARKRLAFGM